ncbi:hypothetical protein CLV62_13128 [Dysgonomonas alginatilytica]|uniref:Uncharacterized protein n=1 Tax=Dysgonomonas alginatilytica TaxID=1605892 RepID=A0A2V3PL88_9BACT|nr:hypothetical protein CLV62_13128 [Dysgonomonas alginatilytica]
MNKYNLLPIKALIVIIALGIAVTVMTVLTILCLTATTAFG